MFLHDTRSLPVKIEMRFTWDDGREDVAVWVSRNRIASLFSSWKLLGPFIEDVVRWLRVNATEV